MKNPKAKGNLQKKTLDVKIKNESKESNHKAPYENLHDLLKAVEKEHKLTSKNTKKLKKIDTSEDVKEKSTKRVASELVEIPVKKKIKKAVVESQPQKPKDEKKVKKADVESQSQKPKDNKKVKKVVIESQPQESKDDKKVKEVVVESQPQEPKDDKKVEPAHEVKKKLLSKVVKGKFKKSKDIKEVKEVKAKQTKIKTENEKEKKTKVKSAKKKITEKAVGDLELNKMNVEKAVDVVFQLGQKEKQEKKSLLPFEGNSIYLQINCIKIPKVPRRRVRMLLPNVMMSSTDEIALFVPDLEKGRRKDYEKTVEHWETILREKGITNINAIIPMNQVKNEYNQYEMRRKLARLYDFFLVDGRIAGHMTHLLGKSFTRLTTPPVPIRLHRENLQEEIKKALKKTTLEIHGYGPCHTVQVATLSMPQKKVVKNVLAVCEQLKEKYPGGFDNIRSILIKTKSSLAIPIYYSLKHKNEVPVPIVKPKRPKAFTVVEGELSTLESDVKVSVTPSGRVTVIPMNEEKENEEIVDKKPTGSKEENKKKEKKIKQKKQ